MAEKTIKHQKGKVLHDLFREVFALHAALAEVMDKVHEQAGLSTAQLKIMNVLNHMGPATVPDIAAELSVSRQFVQTVCNHLLGNELLEFTDNPRHKRSKLAALTEPGRNALKQARDNENKTIEKSLSEIDIDMVIDASKLLEHIRTVVQSGTK